MEKSLIHCQLTDHIQGNVVSDEAEPITLNAKETSIKINSFPGATTNSSKTKYNSTTVMAQSFTAEVDEQPSTFLIKILIITQSVLFLAF